MDSATMKTRRVGDKETERLSCSAWFLSSLSRSHCLMLVFVLSLLVGCSGSGMESQVSGRITLDGQPIGPGIVSFVPAGGKHNPAIGAADAKGVYTLKTSRTGGLSAGHYQVSVYVHSVPPGAQPGERLMSTPSAIPEKYENVETSGLEFDVAPGSQTIDIKLTSK
jgi:hypothetical protein